MRNRRSVAKKFKKKLSKIKVFLVDVDGILTDGKIYWASEEVGFNRSFHALDGYGMKVLMKAGIKCGVVSGGDSLSLMKRGNYLGLDYIFVGNEDKRDAFKKILSDGYTAEEVLYMGDEFFDLPLLINAGFSATVPNASHEIHEVVDYITEREGGTGCVREVIDILRYAQNIVPVVPGL